MNVKLEGKEDKILMKFSCDRSIFLLFFFLLTSAYRGSDGVVGDWEFGLLISAIGWVESNKY